MPGPLKFAEPFLYRFLAVTFYIPFIFIFLKVISFSALPTAISDIVVDVVSFVYPALPQQYETVRRINGGGEAANYALFVFVMLASIFFSIIHIVWECMKNAKYIRDTSIQDLVVAVLMSALAIPVILFFDSARAPEPGYSRLSFEIDDSGSYYLRQFFLLALLCYSLLILTAAILKNFPKSSHTPNPSS